MRYLLAFFFFAIYAGDNLGLNISLGPGLSLKNLMLYAILAGIAVNTAVAHNRKIELPSIVVLFGLLILYSLITWLTVAFILADPEYDMPGSFIRLKSVLADQYITFLIFFFGLLRAKDALWLLRTIVWIAVVGNIVTLIDAFDIPNLGIVEAKVRNDRFLGFIGSANGYGQFLVLFLPATVALYVTTSGKTKMMAAIGLFSTALALVLTGSRGAYVGLLAGSILAAFYLRRNIPTQMIVRAGFIAVTILAVVVSITLAAGYSDLFAERFSRFGGSSHVATSGRSTIWTNAIKAMIENPLSFVTGYGFNAYDSSRSFYASIHNTYLGYLYDLGTIGLVLFMAIFARILSFGRSICACATEETRRYFVALVFGLFSFLIAIFFSEYHEAGYLLWAYVGVVMRLAMEVRDGAAGLKEENLGYATVPIAREQPVGSH